MLAHNLGWGGFIVDGEYIGFGQTVCRSSKSYHVKDGRETTFKSAEFLESDSPHASKFLPARRACCCCRRSCYCCYCFTPGPGVLGPLPNGMKRHELRSRSRKPEPGALSHFLRTSITTEKHCHVIVLPVTTECLCQAQQPPPLVPLSCSTHFQPLRSSSLISQPTYSIPFSFSHQPHRPYQGRARLSAAPRCKRCGTLCESSTVVTTS